MDEERKERECFKFEDLEDNYEEIDSGDENDEMHVGANAEDVGDIIAGNANIHFYKFKTYGNTVKDHMFNFLISFCIIPQRDCFQFNKHFLSFWQIKDLFEIIQSILSGST